MPGSLLSSDRDGGPARPDYLGHDDLPWLQALLDEYRRFAGAPHRALREHLAEGLAAPAPAPSGRLSLAMSVLDPLCIDKPRPAVKPSSVRAALFTAAAARPQASRAELIATAARALEIDAGDLEDTLFADLPREYRVLAPPRSLTPLGLAQRCNLAAVQRLLARAHQVTIELLGNAGAVVRLARLRGLICTVTDAGGGRRRLELSGPLSLFRRTVSYGRALASLVPGLTWCDDFRLLTRCELGQRLVEVEIRAGDPIVPVAVDVRRDSRLEERLLRDLARAAPAWRVSRDPDPIAVGAQLVFPDLALEHRHATGPRWLIEVVGFWTDAHLRARLARLPDQVVLCVDSRRGCGGELPGHPRIVPFRNRIDPRAVLAVIEGSADDGVADLVDDGGAVAARGLEVQDRAQVVADRRGAEPGREPGGGVLVDPGRDQHRAAGPGVDAFAQPHPVADRPGATEGQLPVDGLQGHGGVVRVAHGEGELHVDPDHRRGAHDHALELDPGMLDRTVDTGAPGQPEPGDDAEHQGNRP